MNKLTITLLLMMPILSCSNQEKHANEFNKGKFIISSPFGCYYQIDFDKNGKGILRSYLKKDFIFDYKKNDDSLLNTTVFTFKSHIDSLSRIIKSMGNQTRTGNKAHDAFQFVLNLDGNERINVYNQDKLVNSFIDLFIVSLPSTVKDDCGFFELYKSAHQ